MDFNILIPYIPYLTYVCIGLLILYIRTLIVEKAKNKALRKVNKRLTEETEEIKSKYIREIENLKKEHQLDVEKRKYRYESKQEQYINFFKLLDELQKNSTLRTQSEMIPIIEEFNKNYISASNKKNETKALTVFSEKVQKVIMSTNTELIKLRSETKSIRLIASDEVIRNLDKLEFIYEKTFEESNKMLSDLPLQIISNDQEGMNKNRITIEAIGTLAVNCQNELIRIMRKELNEI